MSDRWAWTSSAWGYEVLCDGRPVGGAGAAKGGRRLNRRALKANARMYRLQAQTLAAECRELDMHLPFDRKTYEEAGIWAWLPAARAARRPVHLLEA